MKDAEKLGGQSSLAELTAESDRHPQSAGKRDQPLRRLKVRHVPAFCV